MESRKEGVGGLHRRHVRRRTGDDAKRRDGMYCGGLAF